jgi:hypothetical protein
MRGRAYAWHGRTVIPTFHPAAILHGGGEKSRQFAELREDFELVRDTLSGMPATTGPEASARPEPLVEPAPEHSTEPPAEPARVPASAEEPVRVSDAEDERAPQEQLELF